MAEETTKIIRIVVDASRAVDGGRAAQRALEEIEKQTGTMAQAMDKLQSSVGNVGNLLKAHLALAATEAVGRLVELGRQAFEAAAGMGELAEKVGLTMRELQALQFVGVQNGATLDDITTAATKFSTKMGEAAEGSKDVIEALKGLGVQNLDVNGKLRANADLMAEVARKIIDIEDPARRSAAQVAFFGKSGTTMAASLQEIAKGLGAVSQEAQKFGAIISDDAIKTLDGLSDAMDRGKLRTRAFLAEGLAAIVEWVDRNKDKLFNAGNAVTGGLLGALFNTDQMAKDFDKFTTFLGNMQDSVRTALDGMVAAGAGFVAAFLQVFRALPDQLGKLMVDGMNNMLDGLSAGLTKLNSGLADSWIGRQIGMTGGGVSLGHVTGGGASLTDYADSINDAGIGAQAAFLKKYGRDYAGDRARQRTLTGQAGMAADEAAARRGSGSLPANLLTGLNSTGGGTSAATGSGAAAEAQAEKLRKLMDTLNAAVTAQDAMTAAARRGDIAFQEQQAAAEATAKAIDFFGGKVSAADPKVKALAETLQKPIFEKMQGTAAQAFVVATTELEKQNELLAAQNSLMNEAPEIQAREIALIKAKNEAQKAGIKDGSEDLENRRKAIEQNETLKLQAEQMKAANELWTAPLKQALQNIQTAGADAFEQILENGKLSAQSLGEVFSKILRRMAAEFLALATIRPVMSLVVEAIGPGGIGAIGGNTASQLGFPTGAGGASGGGGLSSIFGGGGLSSIFSGGGASGGGGWLGRQFSGISSFLSQPIYGGMGSAGLTGSPYYGPPSPSAGMFSGSGPSFGQGIGAAASIGMGAYNLLKGGQSTAGTIGSVGQMVGGAITFLPIPGAQIVGPAISLLSSIIPGLFGGDGPKIPPQPALQYSMGNFYSGGGSGYTYGGDGGGQSIGTNLLKSFRAAGLSIVPGNLYGGELAGGVDHTLKGGQWSDRPYTQTGLITPGGALERLTYNDASMNSQQAGEFLLAQVFKANVMRGGVSGAGAGLKAGLDKINPTTAEDLDRVVSLGTAYDRLGKAINPAKDAIDKISASFDDMKSFATEAGLSLDPINAELKKQSARSAQDFIDAMLDPLAVQMRALNDERASALESAQYIKDNFESVHVDMDRIATYYTNKEAALRDQFYQGGVANLQALIDKLTYGDLANASPTLQLSGTRASYEAALAQARAGDASAITNLSGYAENYLGVARQSFASSPEYQALVEQIRAAAQEVLTAAGGGGSTATGVSSPQQTANDQRIAQLTAMVQDLGSQVASRDARVDQLVDLMQRIATNR